MLNVTNEPKLIQDYNTEYYRLINQYSNIKRSANFVKYYNLAFDISPNKEITHETFDFYTKTQSKWDIYDLTPMQIISAIQNTPENNPDLKGQMILSATTILTYTIENPRIGDLVTFYKPAESEEVLRVMNIRLQLNSNFSSEPVKWYELDLETAPIKYSNLSQLLKNNHYVYDLTIEKNVKYEYYKEFVQKMNNLKELLEDLNKLYLCEADLYLSDGEIVSELNELLFFIKKNFDNRYHRLLEGIRSPFGYWDKYDFKYPTLESMDFDSTKNFSLRNYLTKEEREYNLSSRVDSESLNNTLQKTVDLLKYVKDLGVYLDHTINRDTERF